MLEQLFGSKTRLKVLRLFLTNPKQPYYLREIARALKSQLNSVRREINILQKLGIIRLVELTPDQVADLRTVPGRKSTDKKQGSKKYFITNETFLLLPELKALLLKAQLLLEQNFVRRVEAMPRIQLFILTGIFVGYEDFPTDMLIVGSVNRDKIASLIKKFEKDLGRPLNYTVMTLSEFKYRQDITDRFMFDILEGTKMVVVDKINQI